jgi:hypothetical protein
MMKELFVGIERRQNAAASPTKRIETNYCLESELICADNSIWRGGERGIVEVYVVRETNHGVALEF